MITRVPSNRQSGRRQQERGMAVIVVIAIIAILLIYISGNLRALHFLSRDLKQIEQKQLRRLKAARPTTNTVTHTNLSWTVQQARVNGDPATGPSK